MQYNALISIVNFLWPHLNEIALACGFLSRVGLIGVLDTAGKHRMQTFLFDLRLER